MLSSNLPNQSAAIAMVINYRGDDFPPPPKRSSGDRLDHCCVKYADVILFHNILPKHLRG